MRDKWLILATRIERPVSGRSMIMPKRGCQRRGGTFFKESFSIAYTKRMPVSRANRQGADLLTYQLWPRVDRILLE